MAVFSPVAVLAILVIGSAAGPLQDAGNETGASGRDVPWEESRRLGLVHLRLQDPAGALIHLESAIAKPMPPRERTKTRLLLARARNAAGRHRGAIEALDGIDLSHLPPEIRHVSDFARVLALVEVADGRARVELRRFLETHPKSDRVDRVRLLLAGEALEAGDRKEARRVARLVLDSASLEGHRGQALLLLSRATGGEEGRRFLYRLFTEFPSAPAARECGISEADLNREQLRTRAAAFFRSMDYEGYQRVLEALWEAGERSGHLAMRLAMSHLIYVRDDARKAIDFLERARNGGAVGTAEATYLKARSYAKLEEYDRAAEHYQRYLTLAPRGKRRVKALYYLGWLPYDHGRYQEALPFLDSFLRKVKSHKLRSYIIWAKAWSLYKLKRYREALVVFGRMRKMGNPLVAGKAMYWGGMAHKALGKDREAVRWMQMAVDRYPMTWYAVLSAKRLEQWGTSALPVWMTGTAPGPPAPERWWPLDRLPSSLSHRLRQVKDMAEVGEIERARKAYRRIAREVEKRFKGRERARLLLTVYDAIEDYHALYQGAVRDFGGRMGKVPDADSSWYWMVRYPRAHLNLARVLSSRFHLPELWIYSIMRQESRYRHRQISHTAALGIMQMIPKTAKVIAKVLGVPFEVESFFGPGRNLLFGNYYLAALLEDFKGQIVFASAAYNAGAPPIKRFLEQHRGLPFDEMVEHISYNEARNYSRMVAGHLVRYAYLHLTPDERAALYAKLFPDTVDYNLGDRINY